MKWKVIREENVRLFIEYLKIRSFFSLKLFFIVHIMQVCWKKRQKNVIVLGRQNLKYDPGTRQLKNLVQALKEIIHSR